MPGKKTFAIVLPAANEEETIAALTQELLAETKRLHINASLIFVLDTVSTDRTMSILKGLAKIVMSLMRIFEVFGKQSQRNMTTLLTWTADFLIFRRSLIKLLLVFKKDMIVSSEPDRYILHRITFP